MAVQTTLSGAGAETRLLFTAGEIPLIDSVLMTSSALSISVRKDPLENGCLLTVFIENKTAETLPLPAFNFPVMLSQSAEFLDTARGGVAFITNSNYRTHPLHQYPGTVYSPITAVREEDLSLGIALMYDLCQYQHTFNISTTYRNGRWDLIYTPLDPPPSGEEDDYKITPYPTGTLPPGEHREYRFSICATERSHWLEAFESYKSFFQSTYGPMKVTGDRRPICALSLGTSQLVSDDNPRGYSYRLDVDGWAPLVDSMLTNHFDKGWERFMFWQVAGSYREHPEWNMAFEIASAQTPKSLETIEELSRLTAPGAEIGFWMGRASSISGGFDSGIRRPYDISNPDDVQLWENEIDLARSWGVRMIGLDAFSTGFGNAWRPSGWSLTTGMLPRITGKYSDMTFVIETSPSDYMHLWGHAFMWDMWIPGPPEWQNFLIPGHLTLAVMKTRYLKAGEEVPVQTQEPRFHQLKEWGYIPVVFSSALQPAWWDSGD